MMAASGPIAAVTGSGDFPTRTVEAALLISIYPVYLYFNFSGYTDFVIGCAKLFGLQLPENFNRPFTSVNSPRALVIIQ